MKQANITEDNPLYAVQRIYETAEKSRQQTAFINKKIFDRANPAKPEINRSKEKMSTLRKEMTMTQNHKKDIKLANQVAR